MKANGHNQVRYAVVGLGHIAQAAVLPAFANAKSNSLVTAFISDDPKKQRVLAKEYGVNETFGYEDYDVALRAGIFDAVYIALPNDMHCEYAVRAARAGIHVLCEKPLALDERECEQIIEACATNRVKLMTAYRLHFEHANLQAIQLIKSGKIGEPRIFQSLFTMVTKEGNIRLKRKRGGGTLYDLGVYCINAARYLFQDEPTEVFAYSANRGGRFREVDEMTSAVLRFPNDRLASFTTSFGASDNAVYYVAGTKGTLKMSQGYEYTQSIQMELTIEGRTEKRTYPRRDQFAPELVYFSDCILKNREVEPSGIEGLLDVHIVCSLYKSAEMGRPVRLRELRRRRRPNLKQEIYRPRLQKRRKVHVETPHKS